MVNGFKSKSLKVETGVPQGSVLGPLLFILFINDLPGVTCLKTTLFADDACLSLGGSSLSDLEQVVNEELIKVNSWMQFNRLSLNVEKTFFMLIHNKKHEKDIHVQLNGIEIKRVESVKYLGVIIDQKLQWKAHVDQVAKKLSKCLWAICRLRKYADIKTLSLVYYALAYPHLQYCISSWGGAAQKHLNILLVKQKRLLRLMLKQPFDSPSKPLFKK